MNKDLFFYIFVDTFIRNEYETFKQLSIDLNKAGFEDTDKKVENLKKKLVREGILKCEKYNDIMGRFGSKKIIDKNILNVRYPDWDIRG